MATKWLEERWATLIPALEPLGNDECEEIRAICEAEKEWWQKRPGIKKLGSLGKPMTDTRNHIREVLEVRDDNSWINPKTGVPEHIALKYMNFSTEEWTQMSLPAVDCGIAGERHRLCKRAHNFARGQWLRDPLCGLL